MMYCEHVRGGIYKLSFSNSFYIVIDCGPPTTENFTGEVDYSNTTNGSLALYTCQGNCSNASSICQENGEWTEVLLNCYSKCINTELSFLLIHAKNKHT